MHSYLLLQPHQSPTWGESDTEDAATFALFMTRLAEIGNFVRNDSNSTAGSFNTLELSIDVPHWFGGGHISCSTDCPNSKSFCFNIKKTGKPYATAVSYPTALSQWGYGLSFMVYGGTGTKLSQFEAVPI